MCSPNFFFFFHFSLWKEKEKKNIKTSFYSQKEKISLKKSIKFSFNSIFIRLHVIIRQGHNCLICEAYVHNFVFFFVSFTENDQLQINTTFGHFFSFLVNLYLLAAIFSLTCREGVREKSETK